MSTERFRSRAASQAGPATSIVAVTPDDGMDLPDGQTRGLFVSEPGNIVVRDAAGNTATLVSGGSQYHPLQIIRVLATGTTASGLVALY